jgi:hypothetical protein
MDDSTVSLEQIGHLASLAREQAITVVPCVDFLGDSRWIPIESSDLVAMPTEESPRFLSHLKDIRSISRVLESYRQMHQHIASGYIHIGFRPAEPLDGVLYDPIAETAAILDHFRRLESLFEINRTHPILWTDLFLGPEDIGAASDSVRFSQQEARRRRYNISRDQCTFCLEWYKQEHTKGNEAEALVLLTREGFPVWVMTDYRSVWNRVGSWGDRLSSGELYRMTDLDDEESVVRECSGLIASSAFAWRDIDWSADEVLCATEMARSAWQQVQQEANAGVMQSRE